MPKTCRRARWIDLPRCCAADMTMRENDVSAKTRTPRDGERIDGMKVGMVDESARTGGLPWVGAATRAAAEREAQVREAAEQQEPEPNTAMREFIEESGEQVAAGDLAESGDVAQAATLIAFRKRYGIPPDVTLTPQLIAEVISRKERERQQRANDDPFEP